MPVVQTGALPIFGQAVASSPELKSGEGQLEGGRLSLGGLGAGRPGARQDYEPEREP